VEGPLEDVGGGVGGGKGEAVQAEALGGGKAQEAVKDLLNLRRRLQQQNMSQFLQHQRLLRLPVQHEN
jgi:hypothetical protein